MGKQYNPDVVKELGTKCLGDSQGYQYQTVNPQEVHLIALVEGLRGVIAVDVTEREEEYEICFKGYASGQYLGLQLYKVPTDILEECLYYKFIPPLSGKRAKEISGGKMWVDVKTGVASEVEEEPVSERDAYDPDFGIKQDIAQRRQTAEEEHKQEHDLSGVNASLFDSSEDFS